MSLLRWPRTMFLRITLILLAGLALAQGLTYVFIVSERDEAAFGLMMGYLERDVASSVALLDRLPANERPQWLARLDRRSYRFELREGDPGHKPDSALSQRIADVFETAIGKAYPVHAYAVPGHEDRVQAQVQLGDGKPVTIDLRPSSLPISPWLPAVLAVQLALLGACTWYAVRLATRPLARLAAASNRLGPDLNTDHLPEDGPLEVAQAARAFNAMQARIGGYMTERTHILAAISHDLQTPITRMRMRADMLDDPVQRDKMNRDLAEMQTLVRDGIAYARTLHGAAELPCRLDLDSLLESVVQDYRDSGQDVTLAGRANCAVTTRPQALKRILNNLVDNGLKYAGPVALTVASDGGGGGVAIIVRDFGAGIPDQQLDKVFEPFYRLETSRNRDTGGTGLGLAIARQLATTLPATLELNNHAEGGLQARLVLTEASNTMQK
ncbi:signal transduction histidine kinase [Duganella sp. 3397]|uniref:ATP-binding protein n=1 Tax=Duganella sp. 3397 TaxID=2817732 RepID=UPI00285EB3F1|nr:ATP-binding protein [Duganella sp. 3397]MDR7047948.1 signal transduction histidine kinase [Duganella sp. 3397]